MHDKDWLMNLARARRLTRWLMLVSALLLAGGPALAANNDAPPAGAILDLAGGETGTAAQTIDHGVPVEESVSFVAGVSNTDIRLAFRDDPGFIALSDVSLVDTTSPNTSLLTNGNFSGATHASNGNWLTPAGWTYANDYGASFGGFASSCDLFNGGRCWFDGAVDSYDAISQTIATTIGDTYTLSFYYTEDGGQTTFSDLATPNLAGIDILAYVQDGLPTGCTTAQVCTSAPEPLSLFMFVSGLLGLGAARRRLSAAMQ